MPKIDRSEHTRGEQTQYDAAYNRLREMIKTPAPASSEFQRVLNMALAGGFPIDWPDRTGWTLLHEAAIDSAGVRAGLPQKLIAAGADVNIRTKDGETPLGLACWLYVQNGEPKCLAAIDALLAAGVKPEHDLDIRWIEGGNKPEQQTRRGRLKAYIASWPERRARNRAEDAAPEFDYAL